MRYQPLVRLSAMLTLICTICIQTSSSGQTASAYYRDPVDTTISSRYLDENRGISIILPRSFSRSKATKFPLVVIFDRQNQRIFRQVYESINYLVSFDEMPEVVIIGISSENNQERYWETTLQSTDERARGERMADFIFKELIPWAETALNCGSNRILIGHSRFGYFTSYLLASKMQEVTGVVSCSPFFVQPNVNVVDTLRQQLTSASLKHSVYYRFITGDTTTDTNEYALMHSFLSTAGPVQQFNWKGTALYNAKHMAVPGLGVMPSLLEIFDFWSDEMNKVLRDEQPFTMEVYDRFKQQMKDHYGGDIGLGLAVLNGIGYKFYNQQQFGAAINAWQLLLEEYPMFAQAYISIGNAYAKMGNKREASNAYEQAIRALDNNTLYTSTETEALLAEMHAALKATGN